MNRLIFGKVHISSALPMREELRDLEKTLKISQNRSNFIEKTEVRKRRPSETRFWWFGRHFGASWGVQEGVQNAKRRLQEGPQKHLEKKVSEIIGAQLKKC